METELKKTTDKIGCCQRVKMVLKPIIHYNRDSSTKTVSFVVVPESLRVIFYLYFWFFAFMGIFFTEAFSASFNPEKNPILGTFGVNNICVFFDDPPFSYFAAILYFPLEFIGIIYLYFDYIRVQYYYESGKYPQLTKCFVITYKIISYLIGFSFIVFVQVFGTQPTQSMKGHFLPFLFLMIMMWFLSFMHLLFFLKIDIISKDSTYYWLGILYVTLMGVTVVIKAVLDTTNLFTAPPPDRLTDTYFPGIFAETKGQQSLSQINDILFMIFVTMCPIIIYLIFVCDLDHVKCTLSINSSFMKMEQQKSAKMDDNDDAKENP